MRKFTAHVTAACLVLTGSHGKSEATNEPPQLLFTLKQNYGTQQPPRYTPNPVPRGGHVRVLTHSPAIDEPLRRYDQEVIAAIERCWRDLLKNSRTRVVGTSVIQFEVGSGGTVEKLACVEKSGSEILDKLCESAVMQPAPFKRRDQGRDEPREFRLGFVLREGE